MIILLVLMDTLNKKVWIYAASLAMYFYGDTMEECFKAYQEYIRELQ